MSPHKPVVVVGGGTAGATVVSCLATHCSRDIVLIEPGDASPHDDVMRFLSVLENGQLSRTTPSSLVKDGPIVPYLEGRVQGGGSAINGLLLTGETPPMVAGLTRRAQLHEVGDISGALLQSGGELSQLWWNRGRWNPGRILGYLDRSDRISLEKDDVVALDIDGDRVIGVLTANGYIETDHVVMCAGAIQTPLILLRSGLGKKNGEVGQGLQNHPTVSFVLGRRSDDVGVFDAAVIKSFTVGERDAMMIAYERLNGQSTEEAMLSVAVMNPSSRGRVSLLDNLPDVQFNMLAEPEDTASMREAVLHMTHTAREAHFEAVVTHVMIDSHGSSVADLLKMTDMELNQWIRQNLSAVSHATSSCFSAVDVRTGALRGMSNITIADASILPAVPACTPAAPVTIEARRIAELLGGHLT
jgi:choline dehydrogenase-like flavoprotein